MDSNLSLVVGSSREHLTLLARDSSIGVNQLSHHSTHSLDTKSQWSNVEQYDVADTLFLVKDGTLDSSTNSNNLIRVNALRRLFAEVVLNESLNGRYTA